MAKQGRLTFCGSKNCLQKVAHAHRNFCVLRLRLRVLLGQDAPVSRTQLHDIHIVMCHKHVPHYKPPSPRQQAKYLATGLPWWSASTITAPQKSWILKSRCFSLGGGACQRGTVPNQARTGLCDTTQDCMVEWQLNMYIEMQYMYDYIRIYILSYTIIL